jgi:dihydropteridine reductase
LTLSIDFSGSMWQANVKSAVTTAHLATRFLRPGGLVVFSGAGAAMGPTPGMAGYGIAKAATHQLAR